MEIHHPGEKDQLIIKSRFLSKFVIKCIIPTASVQNTIDFQYFRLKFDY